MSALSSELSPAQTNRIPVRPSWRAVTWPNRAVQVSRQVSAGSDCLDPQGTQYLSCSQRKTGRSRYSLFPIVCLWCLFFSLNWWGWHWVIEGQLWCYDRSWGPMKLEPILVKCIGGWMEGQSGLSALSGVDTAESLRGVKSTVPGFLQRCIGKLSQKRVLYKKIFV